MSLQKQPQHLLNYHENKSVRDILSLVLERGPATIRAAIANTQSSITSEEERDIPSAEEPQSPVHGETETRTESETRASTPESGRSPEAEIETSVDESSSKLENVESNDPEWKSYVEDLPETSSKSPRSSIAIKKGGEREMGGEENIFKFSEHSPQPPGIYKAHLEGAMNPLPPTSTNIQFSIVSGGLVVNEKYFGLPMHATDIASVRPYLAAFLATYGLEFVSICDFIL